MSAQPQATTKLKQEEATILTSTLLLAVQRAPGDKLTPEEVGRVSPNVLQALVSQGIIAFGKAPKRIPTDDEKKAVLASAMAGRKLADAEQALQDTESRLKAAEAEEKRLTERRKPVALKATRGDAQAKTEAERLRKEAVTIKIEIEDLRAAVDAAGADVKQAGSALAEAGFARRKAEAQRIADDIVGVSGRIDEQVGILAELVNRYRLLGRQFIHASGETSAQLSNSWRLESVLNERLNLTVVDPSQRLPDGLAAFEKRMLDMFVRQMKPKEAR